MMLDQLHAATFSAQLHTSFRLFHASTPAQDLELVQVSEREVVDGRQPWATSHQERFALLFRGDQQRALQQGMHRMRHDRLGDLELFLVPVGQDQQSTYYEVVFNRLRQPDA